MFRPPGNDNIDKPIGWAIVDKLHTLSNEYDGCGQAIVDDMTNFSMTRRAQPAIRGRRIDNFITPKISTTGSLPWQRTSFSLKETAPQTQRTPPSPPSMSHKSTSFSKLAQYFLRFLPQLSQVLPGLSKLRTYSSWLLQQAR